MEKFWFSMYFNNLWSFIKVYAGVFLQIYVGKNLCRENLCGEKMTNMWSVFTMLTLLKRLTLLALILCMNTLFFFDCFCHQELKNGAHNGLWKVYAVFRMGWMGRD